MIQIVKEINLLNKQTDKFIEVLYIEKWMYNTIELQLREITLELTFFSIIFRSINLYETFLNSWEKQIYFIAHNLIGV